MPDRTPERDTRPWILGGVGCLGLCLVAVTIPVGITLAAMGNGLLSVLLPVLALFATAVTLAIIWLAPPRRNVNAELDALRAQVHDLHERLSNLEMIDSYGERFGTPNADTTTEDYIPPRERERERGL
jgi:hypothetical protein